MALRAGAKVDATDYYLPNVVTAYGNGINTITSTTFAVLPTTTCTAAITNPHPTATMLTLVSYGAWLTGITNDVRISLDISGSLTIAAGVGGGAASGWGEVPIATVSPSIGGTATITVELPPSATAATFKVYGMRGAASGTQTANYPTIRLIPLRYLL